MVVSYEKPNYANTVACVISIAVALSLLMLANFITAIPNEFTQAWGRLMRVISLMGIVICPVLGILFFSDTEQPMRVAINDVRVMFLSKGVDLSQNTIDLLKMFRSPQTYSQNATGSIQLFDVDAGETSGVTCFKMRVLVETPSGLVWVE